MWSDWSSFSPCTCSCGGGTQAQTRVCNRLPKELGGTGCTGKHTRFRVCNKQVCCMSVSICNYFNPIPPGGVCVCVGGGGGKCPRRFQLSRTSLIFKQYLPNVATFTKIYWRTRFWKNFASRVKHVAMQPHFRRHVYSKFDFLIFFSIN